MSSSRRLLPDAWRQLSQGRVHSYMHLHSLQQSSRSLSRMCVKCMRTGKIKRQDIYWLESVHDSAQSDKLIRFCGAPCVNEHANVDATRGASNAPRQLIAMGCECASATNCCSSAGNFCPPVPRSRKCWIGAYKLAVQSLHVI